MLVVFLLCDAQENNAAISASISISVMEMGLTMHQVKMLRKETIKITTCWNMCLNLVHFLLFSFAWMIIIERMIVMEGNMNPYVN